MKKSKAQNKFKIKIANVKTRVLSLGICHLNLFLILSFGI